MRFPELIPAVFIKRGNRFTAGVKLESGGFTTAYVPTTGRLTGALHPGGRVWLSAAKNLARRTAYNLVLTELENGGYCSVNAVMANYLFNEHTSSGRLGAFQYEVIDKEVTIGRSRLDFRLSTGKETCWVEVKSVTFAQNGMGKFPDAPTARGRRHMEELVTLVAQGDRASAVFIVQREDAHTFGPFDAIDPEFGSVLRTIYKQGVEVHAYRCDVTTSKIEIAEEIPVEL